jgi:Tfp pilus assembly protein PilX
MQNLSCKPRQRGVVLLITLIVLLAMTFAGIALTRSVDTGNLIAGNLAFQQAAIQSGDTGIEAAVDWLEANGGPALYGNATGNGYVATWQPPLAAGQTWDDYWSNVLAPVAVVLPEDAQTGNTVSYVIQRLCNTTGALTVAGCSAPFDDTDTSSKSSGAFKFNFQTKTYYRITARIDGPRNTVGYVQAIVAM